ncbi:MAG TPA: hypothetical protein VFG39_01445 [Balneolaceae bacterium]|nr:hypothetical protein [Balneolaceae bacterium]
MISADSTPVYDTPFWPFDAAWDCSDWLEWRKELVRAHGRPAANKKFLKAWKKQSFWSWNVSFCKYDSEFADYFQSVGLEPENFVAETVNNLKDAAVNTSGTLAKLGTFKGILVLLFAVFLVIWYKDEIFS